MKYENIINVFIGTMGRDPSIEEIKAWDKVLPDTGYEKLLSASLKISDEFIESLAKKSYNIWELSESNKLFFLHIQKTGGQALEMALRAKLGFPALTLHRQRSQIQPVWPVIKSHTPIVFAPTGYKIITVVRNPLIRLFSYYRFQNSNNPLKNPNSVEEEHSPVGSKFSEWIYAMDGKNTGASFAWMLCSDVSDPAIFLNLTNREKIRKLKSGIKKLDFATWTGQYDLPDKLFGNIRMNDLEVKKYNFTNMTNESVIEIDRTLKDKLDEILEFDYTAIELLQKYGKLNSSTDSPNAEKNFTEIYRVKFV